MNPDTCIPQLIPAADVQRYQHVRRQVVILLGIGMGTATGGGTLFGESRDINVPPQAGTFSLKSHASLIWLKTNGLEQVNVMGPEGVQRMKVGEHPLANTWPVLVHWKDDGDAEVGGK
jgi:hypothetical protein